MSPYRLHPASNDAARGVRLALAKVGLALLEARPAVRRLAEAEGPGVAICTVPAD